MRSRRLTLKSFITIILIFATTGVVSAKGLLDGSHCNIDADTVISGDLFVLCGELIVEGHVEGHIIGTARTTTITNNGQVDGSIYLLGGELNMNGTLGKDIHFAGLSLNVENEANFQHEGGAILSLNLNNTIMPDAVVPGNVTNLGYQLIVGGDVGHEINFWGSALTISGNIGSDVTATVGNSESRGSASQIETLLIPLEYFLHLDIELIDPGLILTADGSINGQLEYTGPTPGRIRGETESRIYHSTQRALVGTPAAKSATSVWHYLGDALGEFTTLMFIAATCLLFIPRQVQSPIKNIRKRPISTLGVGLLGFIMSFTIVIIIAVMSFIFMFLLTFLPLLDDVVLFAGVVLGLANIGWASVFYFTAIYIGRVVVALAVGRAISTAFNSNTDHENTRSSFINMAIGVWILSMLGAIPIFGWIFNALALFLGLGAILHSVSDQIKRFRESSGVSAPPPPIHYATEGAPRLPYYPEDARLFAPPMIDDRPNTAGTSNLPEGFEWWEADD